MVEEVKLSELLQTLLEQQETILKTVQNLDQTNKLILGRMNKIIASGGVKETAKDSEITFKPVSSPVATINVEASGQPSVKAIENPVPNKKPKSALEKALEADDKKHARKIPTRQKITFLDGKILFLATVNIYDLEDNLINSIKTNTQGEYQTGLKPDEYMVQVIKNKTDVRPAVDFKYHITVKDGKTCMLEPQKVNV